MRLPGALAAGKLAQSRWSSLGSLPFDSVLRPAAGLRLPGHFEGPTGSN